MGLDKEGKDYGLTPALTKQDTVKYLAFKMLLHNCFTDLSARRGGCGGGGMEYGGRSGAVVQRR